MILTPENYYSEAANYEYMSVSQFKDFAGSYGKTGCEECAMEKLKGEWCEPKSTALLVGSYVDSYFEGSLPLFLKDNPEVFIKASVKSNPDNPEKWELLKAYRQANEIISRVEDDDYFMTCMSGEKQVIMTGNLFGIPWKIKMDSYIPDKVIVDLKIVESIKKVKWVKDVGYLDFIRYWGYDIQGAIYQEIVYQNTGKRLPFYIAAATKEKTTDLAVIHVQDHFLRMAMSMVQFNIERIKRVKSGEEKPSRCEVCDYCLTTKVLHHPIGLLDLVPGI